MSQTPFPGERTFHIDVVPSVERSSITPSDRILSEMPPPRSKRTRAPKLTEEQEYRLFCIMYEAREWYNIARERTKWWVTVEENFNRICRLDYHNVREYSSKQLRQKWRSRQQEKSGEESTTEMGSWMQAATRWYEFVIESDRMLLGKKAQTAELEAVKQRTLTQRDNMGKRLTEKSPVSRPITAVSWSPTPQLENSSQSESSTSYQDSSPDSSRKSQRRRQAEQDRGEDRHLALLESIVATVKSVGESSSQATRLELLERRVVSLERVVAELAEVCREVIEERNERNTTHLSMNLDSDEPAAGNNEQWYGQDVD